MLLGGVPVRRRREVMSEHGEPLAWQTTVEVGSGPVVALCRCGGSTNKPFCDGTHRRIGFEGTEAEPRAPYDTEAATYTTPTLTMRDDRGLCVHAGFCGNRVTNVWKMMKASAVDDSIVRAQVIDMIEKCPSGALSVRLPGDEADLEPDLPVAVAVVDDGPLFITGRLPVIRSDGERLEVRNRMTLCRCGQSGHKPLCDGSHKAAGFTDR
jgi:CDGSH-type Zn-finger protein